MSLGMQKYGNETALEKNAIKHLYDVYVRINRDIHPNDHQRNNGSSNVPLNEQSNKIAPDRASPEDDVIMQAKIAFKALEQGDPAKVFYCYFLFFLSFTPFQDLALFRFHSFLLACFSSCIFY